MLHSWTVCCNAYVLLGLSSRLSGGSLPFTTGKIVSNYGCTHGPNTSFYAHMNITLTAAETLLSSGLPPSEG